jgi:hypothetical protein
MTTPQRNKDAGKPGNGGQFAGTDRPDFDGKLVGSEELAREYRYQFEDRTFVFAEPVVIDHDGNARTYFTDEAIEPLSAGAPFRSRIAALPQPTKTPPNHHRLDADALRYGLAALEDGNDSAIDLFAGSVINGHLSRGTAGRSGVEAAQAWRDEARARADLSADPRHDEFADGVEDAAVALMGSKLGVDGTEYGRDDAEADEIRTAAFVLLRTKRASAEDREQWRKDLGVARSEATWRGMMVGAAALSGTDSWWGFRDDIDRTILGV